MKELNLERDNVNIEIIEEPVKGFFGLLGAKEAKVTVTENIDAEKRAKQMLTHIFRLMHLDVGMSVETNDNFTRIDLSGPDLGILIGRRGETLDAFQYFVNLAANKFGEKRVRFLLDVEGYRRRREETLSNLALRLAEKARRKGKDVVLEPMNPHERRVIHTTLQDHKEVFTYSEGEEPYRKIIIAPKK